jgi:hypothetical protein
MTIKGRISKVAGRLGSGPCPRCAYPGPDPRKAEQDAYFAEFTVDELLQIREIHEGVAKRQRAAEQAVGTAEK